MTPISLLQTWNTFFPDSNWDSGRAPGHEGTQTVNIVVLCEYNDTTTTTTHNTYNTSNPNTNKKEFHIQSAHQTQWAVSDYKWASVPETRIVGMYDKYVRLNVEYAVKQGLL